MSSENINLLEILLLKSFIQKLSSFNRACEVKTNEIAILFYTGNWVLYHFHVACTPFANCLSMHRSQDVLFILILGALNLQETSSLSKQK